MSRALTQSEIDRAGMGPGGAYASGASFREPKVVQTVAPSMSMAANSRGRLLYLIAKARELAAKQGHPFQDNGRPDPRDADLAISIGALANELLMATEHAASTITMAERAKARNEAIAVIGELEAAAGDGPYRGPASVGVSHATEPDDSVEYPALCAFCGGALLWREKRILDALLADGRSKVDGLVPGEVACLSCFVPRAR